MTIVVFTAGVHESMGISLGFDLGSASSGKKQISGTGDE